METKKDLIDSTLRQLLQIARKYSRIEALPVPIEADLKITTAEAHTIQAVGEGEKIRVMDIATQFGITKSAASQMVAKLISKGFLRKDPSPSNGKEFPLSLTENGWLAFNAHEQHHGKDYARILDRLNSFSLSQISTISVMLETIGDVMEERLLERPHEKKSMASDKNTLST